jgi:hypothetical protein
LPGPVLIEKINFFARTPNHPYKSRHPVPLEGRWPSSRTLGRVAVDAAASGAWWCSQGGPWFVSGHNVRTTGEAAYGKAVWFWHPLLVSSWRRKVDPTGFRQSFNPPAMEARGIRLQGERYKPSNHCAGNAGVLQLYLYARVRFFALVAHETAGAASTRHSLRPLLDGRNDFAKLGHRAARTLTHIQLSSPGLTGRPSIPEAAVIEPRRRGVLDTRLRGYDDPLFGEWTATRAITLRPPKATRPFKLITIRNNPLLQVNGNCASDARL